MAQKEETMLQNAIRVKLSEVGLVLRNNVGTYLTRYGAPIAIGVPGLSDLTLFANGGTTVFIEIKNNHGTAIQTAKTLSGFC